ncbi:MAG: hypothetical protein ACLQNE_00900 [Thermoguttaceae bacterium]
MTERNARSSRRSEAVAVLIVSLGSLALLSARSKAAEPAGAVNPAGPVVMETGAVTLEIVCRDGAMEGEFHPIRSRMLEVTTWGGGPQAHADLAGYGGRPGGRGLGKPGNRPKPKPAAKQQAAAVTILATLKPEGDAILQIDTLAGEAAIRLQDIDFGTPRTYLDGKIVAQRLPAATRFAMAPSDNDYPAAARGRDGDVWVAYVAYRRGGEPDMTAAARGDFRTFVPAGNGDQIRLVKFDGKEWSAPMPVTEPLLDLWKPTVAVGGAGRVWIAWSQNVNGNWDIRRGIPRPALLCGDRQHRTYRQVRRPPDGRRVPARGPADAGDPRPGNRADHPPGHRPQQSLRLQHRAEPRDPGPEMDRRRSAARAR